MKQDNEPASAGDVDMRADRSPTTDPRVGDTWTRGKATLQITAIDADGRITLTPSGPEIASTPTTWSRAGWAGSVCSWPGWTFGGAL